jgi:hypothetical protein
VVRINAAKWRGALTRIAIVVLMFALLLEVTFMSINIQVSNNLSLPGLAYVQLNKSDAYALIIESLPNVKYRVDVTLQVIRGSALVILSNGSKVTMTASTTPSIIEVTLTRGLRYIGPFPQCTGYYTWLNLNGSLVSPSSLPSSIPSNVTFKVIMVSFALSISRPINAALVNLGSLSTSTLSNATYIVNVLNVTTCDNAVSLTPALIVIGLTNGTTVSLSWSYRVVEV